jgi:hypothetical protein
MPQATRQIRASIDELSFGARVTIMLIAIGVIVLLNWLFVGILLSLLSYGWPVFDITWSQTFPVSLAFLLIKASLPVGNGNKK